jgi:PAS domain S-box-containing protein
MKDSSKTKRDLIQELEETRRGLEALDQQVQRGKTEASGSRPFAECHESFFEDSADALYISSREGRLLDVNPAWLSIFGYSRKEFTRLNFRDLYVNPADRPVFQAEIEKGGTVKDYELLFKKKDGTTMTCLLTSSVRYAPDGAVDGYQGIIRDITEKKAMEGRLRRSEEKFSKVFRSSPDWIVISTLAEGRLVDVNDAFLRITGYSREEVLGKTSADLNLWADYSQRAETVKLLVERGEIRNHEVRFRMKSGEILTMSRSAELIDLNGVPCIINVTRDISEQKRSEEEIRSLNRQLEERVVELTAANRDLDAFNYSVSHDLRAPLIVIGGFTRLLIRNYRDALDQGGQEMLNTISSTVDRMENLIDALLAFSRSARQQLRVSDVPMTDLAREVLAELVPTAPGRVIDATVHLLPPARGDRAMLRQVLTNLISNAIKFTSRKERAVIEVGGFVDDEENVYFVRDNGAGFDPQKTAKLFGVFQRLHLPEDFSGTGVGLSIVQRIIQRHGGRVWAEGKPGEGATFHFTIPLQQV